MLADRVRMRSGKSKLVVASGDVLVYNDIVSKSTIAEITVRNVKVNCDGVVKVVFTLSGNGGGQIFVNAIGTVTRSTYEGASFTQEITVKSGDNISFVLAGAMSALSATNESFKIYTNISVPIGTFVKII